MRSSNPWSMLACEFPEPVASALLLAAGQCGKPVCSCRNGTNARAFRTWCGRQPSQLLPLVKQHLEEAQQRIQCQRLQALIDKLTSETVAINSCKAMHTLVTLASTAQSRFFACSLQLFVIAWRLRNYLYQKRCDLAEKCSGL